MVTFTKAVKHKSNAKIILTNKTKSKNCKSSTSNSKSAKNKETFYTFKFLKENISYFNQDKIQISKFMMKHNMDQNVCKSILRIFELIV